MGWFSVFGFASVSPGRFERPTFCSGGKRSIQLSYGDLKRWGRDSNSRSRQNRTVVFETTALGHYATPPFGPSVRPPRVELESVVPARKSAALCARGDSNSQPSGPARKEKSSCVPREIRTLNLILRRDALCPVELWGLFNVPATWSRF